MSLEAELVVVAVVAPIMIPLAVMIVRRKLRGEPFRKSGTVSSSVPSPPPVQPPSC